MDKVLIATPYYYGKQYCLNEFLESINRIKHKNIKFLMIDNSIKDKQLSPKILEQKLKIDWDLIYLNAANRRFNSREVLAYCYSIILSYFEGYKFDYLLTLEADVLIPPEGLSLLIETAKKYQGLVCPLVYRSNGQLQVYKNDMKVWNSKNNKGFYIVERTPYKNNEIKTKAVIKVGSATFSCLLIPIIYTKDLKINWFKNHYNHPDIFFYDRVKSLNIPVWVDTRVICKHKQRAWNLMDIVW